MKRTIWLLLLTGLVCLPAAAKEFKVQKTEDIQKTLAFADPSGAGEILVDNIFGSITVEGYSGKDVKLTIRKTIKGGPEMIMDTLNGDILIHKR